MPPPRPGSSPRVSSPRASSWRRRSRASRRFDGELNAVIHPLFEKALETEPAHGPFRGVPLVVKDLVCTTAGDPHHEGMPASCVSSAGARTRTPGWPRACARRASCPWARPTRPSSGILPTTEPLAYGPTRNPWDTRPLHRGLERRLGRRGGLGHGAACARERRRRLDPHPRLLLRPRRAQAHARARLAGAEGDFAPGRLRARGVPLGARQRRGARMLADPPPGDPYFAPARARPYTRGGRGRPGTAAGIGLMTTPPGWSVRGPPGLRGRRRGGRRPRVARPLVEPAYPAALDDEAYIDLPRPLDRPRRGRALDFWSARPGAPSAADDVEPLTWALGRAGPRPLGGRLPERDRPTAAARRVRGSLAGGRTRPAAHPDDGCAPSRDRDDRHGRRRGRAAGADRAGHAPRRLHRRLQRHRPAGMSLPLHCGR